jgi:hypothetical protein
MKPDWWKLAALALGCASAGAMVTLIYVLLR